MVIALTGNARQGQIDQAMEAGMDDGTSFVLDGPTDTLVVIKPYVLSQLLKKIRAMFAKRAEAKALADVE
jgi:CheY-like chemotaxis protein